MTKIDVAAVIGGNTLFSRADGQRIGGHIRALDAAEDEDLQLNFQGIHLLSFSAAHEGVGKTFEFMRRHGWTAKPLVINLSDQAAESLDASLRVVGLTWRRVRADGSRSIAARLGTWILEWDSHVYPSS